LIQQNYNLSKKYNTFTEIMESKKEIQFFSKNVYLNKDIYYLVSQTIALLIQTTI